VVDSARAWGLVRLGLSLMYYGMATVLGVCLAYIGVTFGRIVFEGLETVVRRAEGGDFIGPVELAAGGLIVAAILVAAIGRLLCCLAPQARLRGLVVGSIACQAGAAILAVGLVFLYLFWRRERGLGNPFDPLGIKMTSLLLSGYLLAAMALVGGQLLFMAFLRELGRLFQERRLERYVSEYVFLFVIVIVFSVLFACSGLVGLEACLGLIVLVLAFVLLGCYVRILGHGRDILTVALKRNSM
jgi:hypothetical protein